MRLVSQSRAVTAGFRAPSRRTLVTGGILALLLPYAAYTLFGLGRPQLATLFNEGFHDVLMLVAAGLVAARAIRVRKDRMAWGLIAAGMTSYALGEVVYYVFLAKLESPPYPSVGDALWLGFYPATYVGLVLLLCSRVREFQRSLWLDGLIAALAAAAVAAAVLFGVVATDTGGSVAVVATNLAYPLGDIILVSIAVAVYALAGGLPGRDWVFLGAGLCTLAIADSIWLYQTAGGTYTPGESFDLMWPVGMLLIGMAAWQPALEHEIQLTGLRRVVLPVASCLVAIAIETYDHFHPIATIAIVVTTALLVAITARLALSFGENLRMLAGSKHQARTDPLTGLGNRRSLVRDVGDRLPGTSFEHPLLLGMFDLDGFKAYNDVFGHPAGDALLARLGSRLERVSADHGKAYRLGGDEFCVLLDATHRAPETLMGTAAAALTDHGDGFSVTTSYGWVLLPKDATEYPDAMRLADQRMYAQKHGGRQSAGRQSSNVLLHALNARNPGLGDHLAGVSELAEQVARRAGLGDAEVEEVRLAAELHDVGKMGIPDAILGKPGPLTGEERAFVRRHTVVGERILLAAPALAGVAKLVRASHERWDGDGYPDRLARSDIPYGARIITICNSFDSMISDRPYRAAITCEEALTEVRRCAGSQFDPVLVDAFCDTMEARTEQPSAAREPLLAGSSMVPASGAS